MKYLITGIVILAVILSLCLLFSYLSDCYVNEVKEALHDAADFLPAEDWETLCVMADHAESCWNDRRDFFSSLLEHEDLEEIDRTFVSLRAYARSKEETGYYESYMRLISMLEHIQNMDDPKLYNFLLPIVNHSND